MELDALGLLVLMLICAALGYVGGYVAGRLDERDEQREENPE